MADQTNTSAPRNYDDVNFREPLTVQDVNHLGGDRLSLSLVPPAGMHDRVMSYLRQSSPILFCPPDAVDHLTGNATAGGDYQGIDFARPFMVNEAKLSDGRVSITATIPPGVNWDQARTYLKDGAQILAVPPDAVQHLTRARAAGAGGANI